MRRTVAPEAARLDVELLRRAASNLDTVAQEMYDRCAQRPPGDLIGRRSYECYSKLTVLAAGLRKAIEDRHA